MQQGHPNGKKIGSRKRLIKCCCVFTLVLLWMRLVELAWHLLKKYSLYQVWVSECYYLGMGNCLEIINPDLDLNKQLSFLKSMLVLVDQKMVSDFRFGKNFQQEALSFTFDSDVNNTALYEPIGDIIWVIESLENLPNILKLLLLKIDRACSSCRDWRVICFSLDYWCGLYG